MDKEPRRDIDIDAANEVFSLRDTEFIPNKREVCREQPIRENMRSDRNLRRTPQFTDSLYWLTKS